MMIYLIVDSFKGIDLLRGAISNKDEAIKKVKELVQNEIDAAYDTGKFEHISKNKWITQESECDYPSYDYDGSVLSRKIYYIELIGDRLFSITEVELDKCLTKISTT